MKMRRMRPRKIKLGRRLEFAVISPTTITVNSELGGKDANFTIQKFASNSKRVDQDPMDVRVVGIAKISIKKYAEVLCRGSLAIDPEGPVTSFTQDSKRTEILEAENTPRRTIF